MPQVTLRYKVDAKEAIRKLAATPAGLSKAALKTFRAAATRIVEMMQTEPSPLPRHTRKGQKYPAKPYRRTGKYVAGWHLQDAKAAGIMVLNRVEYAKYVGGLLNVDTQAEIHRGRWILFRDAVTAVMGDVPKLVVNAFRRFQMRGYRSGDDE